MFDPKALMDQFLGGNQMQGGGRSAGMGGDLGQLARQFGGSGGMGKGLAAGGLAGLLLGSKSGRKMGKKALKIGGMALVGGLAYKAYRDWQAGQAPATTEPAIAEPPAGTAFNPTSTEDQHHLGLTLIRAMIAAAKADGHIDAEEQSRIFEQMGKLALDSEAKAFLMDELRAPLDVDAIARAARNKEEAAEIYMASLLAIDPDHPAEQGYLAMLAGRLGLERDLVAHLDATVEAAARD